MNTDRDTVQKRHGAGEPDDTTTHPSLSSKPKPAAQKEDTRSIRPTGIGKLDMILSGGFPSDSTVLLAGSSGSGKTVLAMQWLFTGYKKYGEPGLYLALTEPMNKAIRNTEKFMFCDRADITIGKVHCFRYLP